MSVDSMQGPNFISLTDYGELQLPEFNEAEQVIRALNLNYEVFEVAYADRAERLRGLETSEALRAIDVMVNAFVVKQLFEVLDSGLNFDHARNAVLYRKWAGVDKDSSEKFALLELNARANQLKYTLVKEWIDTLSPDLSPIAALEYRNLMTAMTAGDRMALKLILEKFPIDAKTRAQLGLKNECAVVRGTADEPYEVPLYESYPEETDAMVASYEDLLTGFYSLLAETEEGTVQEALLLKKIPYYEMLLEATRTSDPQKWAEMDNLFAGQIVDNTQDVMNQPPMETGYLGDATIRFPEIGLRAPDKRAERAQQIAEDTKQRMLTNLSDPRFLGDCPTILETVPLLEKTNVTFRHFLGSGFELFIMPKGQAVPNEFASREIGGTDVSLDLEAERVNYAPATKFVKAVFGEQAFDRHFESPEERDFDVSMGRHTASHEYAHVMALKADTYERIGDRDSFVNPYVEVWKATALGAVANEWIPFLRAEEREAGSGDLGRLGQVIKDMIFDACRHGAQRNAPGAPNYFRMGMMFMKVAEDVGILRKTGTGEFPWEIHLEEQDVIRFFQTLTAQAMMVAEIYGEGQENDLRSYLEHSLQSTPFIEFLCARFPIEGEKHTPDYLASLPARTERIQPLEPALVEAREVVGGVAETITS